MHRVVHLFGSENQLVLWLCFSAERMFGSLSSQLEGKYKHDGKPAKTGQHPILVRFQLLNLNGASHALAKGKRPDNG